MKKLYITDLDGTLLNDNAQLSELSKSKLKSLINDGAAFTVATARTFATVINLFDGIGLSLPLVLMNGVMIYDPINCKAIKSHTIKTDTVKNIISIFKNRNLYPLVYFDLGDRLEIKYSDLSNKYQMEYVNNRNHSKGKLFTYSPSLSVFDDDKIIYLVTLDKYENIIDLYNEIKKIDDITCVFYKDNYTDCYFFEIFAKGVSKASGLNEVRKITETDKVIAFGDNLNDLEMFKSADEAYAVSNACDELKTVAVSVIGSNNDDSVAKYIYNDFYGEK